MVKIADRIMGTGRKPYPYDYTFLREVVAAWGETGGLPVEIVQQMMEELNSEEAAGVPASKFAAFLKSCGWVHVHFDS